MEPWLDSLSDDWHPEPTSAQQTSAPSCINSSVAPRSRASRIPKYVSSKSPAAPRRNESEGRHDDAQSEDTGRENAMDAKLSNETKSSNIARNSLSTTIVSNESVVQHKSTQPIAPGQPVETPQTPDWKQLAMRNQDLFSPAGGLENIFKKPENHKSSSPLKKTPNNEQDSDLFPSSPPPWNSRVQRAPTDASLLDNPLEKTSLEPVQELEEAEHFSSQSCSDLVGQTSMQEKQVQPADERGATIPEATELSYPNEDIEYPRQDLANLHSSSSVTNGFSPVFISKHNTVDGRVNYAAFDPAELPTPIDTTMNHDTDVEHDISGSQHFRSSVISAIPSGSVCPSESVSQVRHDQNDVGASANHGGKLDSISTRENATNSANESVRGPSSRISNANASRPGPQLSDLSDPRSIQTVLEAENPLPMLATPTSAPGETSQIYNKFVDREGLSPLIRGRKSSSQAHFTDHSRTPRSVRRSYSSSSVPSAQSLAGKKRKDARYEDTKVHLDGSAISRREIIRPRNPTPWQGKHERDESGSMISGIPSKSSDSDNHSLPKEIQDTTRKHSQLRKARALASQAASMRLPRSAYPIPQDRKKSISTQDYLNEAMRIMDLIRARKKAATSDSSSILDPASDAQDFDPEEGTAPTISRPPSRDGPQPAWRSQVAISMDPGVESQLRKFEETGDESFLVSSIVRSVQITEQGMYEHEQDGVRIIDNPFRHTRRRHSDPEHSMLGTVAEENVISKSSRGSTESSRQSGKTDSTHKLSSVGRIAPETVSHLIQQQEGGMILDTEKKTWIKCRGRGGDVGLGEHIPSSVTTEEDPFADIPDLSTNEQSALVSEVGQPQPDGSDGEDGPTGHNASIKQRAKDAGEENEPKVQQRLAHAVELDEEQPLPTTNSQPTPKNAKHTRSWNQNVEADDSCISETPITRSTTPPQRVRRRREQSVFFSSPPVSKEWEARHWTDSTEPERFGRIVEEDELDVDNSQLVRWNGARSGRTPPQRQPRPRWNSSVHQSLKGEHREISFIEHRPDGRTLSLSMSVSTPHPMQQSSNARVGSHHLAHHSSFMQSLTPLSDFSFSNDSKSRQVRRGVIDKPFNIVRREQALEVVTASTTADLVERLTDVEPDEPYWDFMHRLNLANKRLESINMLEQFCPRLETLDLSENRISHLSGAPVTIRYLDLTHNHLNSLSNFSRLINLQYVDLSSNHLTTLEGFAGLFHLRELHANNNHISSVEGVLDLDGLISLSLKGNKLKNVDFTTAQLRHLCRLDLSCNSIETFDGLLTLPALTSLDLSSNSICNWLTGNTNANSSLEFLGLNRNTLADLDVSELPGLKTLEVDNNRLSGIQGIEGLPNLHTLHLRHQVIDAGTFTSLDPSSNLTTVLLTGTSLPPLLPITVPALNLRTLDCSFTGLRALPSDFGSLCPNLQQLDLSANNLKDLRPLDGIVALRKLNVARNRIGRLRKLVKSLAALGSLVKGGGMLDTLNCRENPLTVGFYNDRHAKLSCLEIQKSKDGNDKEGCSTGKDGAEHVDAKANDLKHLARLDDETKMKRRIYEMLISSRCPKLKTLDDLSFEREEVQRKDEVWEWLVEAGVVEKA